MSLKLQNLRFFLIKYELPDLEINEELEFAYLHFAIDRSQIFLFDKEERLDFQDLVFTVQTENKNEKKFYMYLILAYPEKRTFSFFTFFQIWNDVGYAERNPTGFESYFQCFEKNLPWESIQKRFASSTRFQNESVISIDTKHPLLASSLKLRKNGTRFSFHPFDEEIEDE